ncbi:ATP-binding cassette domain-containing protein [Abiotrophia defectiva]|uniref:ATP-binding cassette domain-containing protein n=1 Tax=Abiotrophia defectiva TaxID=46125 RepID=UPI0026EAA191|nr:ATP-binding cassette domain-containing protein [Abiotrophia defectiva]
MIHLAHMDKNFGRHQVLKDVNLDVPTHSFTVIHGKSGSGKSTLLNILGLLTHYDAGQYQLFGQPAPAPYSSQAMKLRREAISYVFQNFALIDNESIEQNLKLASHYLSKSQASQQAMLAALEAVNLDLPLKTKVYTMSGGEKQRLAVARLKLRDSRLILADEPTGSLDADNKTIIIQLLRSLADQGKAVLVVTHDPDFFEVADSRMELN